MHYATLHQGFLRRTRSLSKLASRAGAEPEEAERLLTYVTVSLFNQWTEFSRTYCVSIAMRPKTINGVRVKCGVPLRMRTDVVLALMRSKRRFSSALRSKPNGPWTRKEEPRWDEPTTIVECLVTCQASNHAAAVRAFGFPVTVFTGLRLWRNFFSHRNPDTMRAVLKEAPLIGLPAIGRPGDLLLQPRVGGNAAVIQEWVGELEMVAEELCK